MKKRINVVFQGGGVRGIAHVGAWKAIQDSKDIEVVGVGGSSVGAIVACLIAAGYTATELETEMKKKPLNKLLGPSNRSVRQIVEEIEDVRKEIETALQRSKEWFGFIKAGWYLKSLLDRLQNLRQLASEVLSSYGLYDTKEVIKWLQDLLDKKKIVTVKDLKVRGNPGIEKFRIVTSDVTHCGYRHITENDSTEEIATVVGQSISMPIFFKPFKVGESYYVDGGMLSNYPLWLFQVEDEPTVGIRLRSIQDEKLSYPIDNFFNYILALLWTMVGAHDRFRGMPPGCYPLDVPTGEIGATDFDLDEGTINKLLVDGELYARKFDWNTVDPKRKIPFKDSFAEEILYEAMEATREICFFSGGKKELEVSRYEFTLTIEKDGTAVREFEQEVKNLGRVPLINSAHSASELKIPVSFKDMDFKVEDKTPGKTKEQRVSYIPFKNTSDEKGIAIFYMPPVYEGESRTLHASCTIPERYKTTLLRGRPDDDGLNLSAAPGNKVSFGKIIYRILVDRELGELAFKEMLPGGTSSVADSKWSRYREYKWEFGGGYTGVKFEVNFWLKS